VKELDFTIELNAEGLSDRLEAEMFAEADSRLRELASDHDDLTGAAINIRQPAKTETSFLHEVTVVVYSRPEHIAATTREADPIIALNDSLSAAEQQVRERREKLRDQWKRPGNDPVSTEILDIEATEARQEES
jgi:ribosome-associated translation inhibitor RaiA